MTWTDDRSLELNIFCLNKTIKVTLLQRDHFDHDAHGIKVIHTAKTVPLEAYVQQNGWRKCIQLFSSIIKIMKLRKIRFLIWAD